MLSDIGRAIKFYRGAYYGDGAYPQAGPSRIEVTGCLFQEMNYLKTVADGGDRRMEGWYPLVYNDQLRHRGLILEIVGNFTGVVIIRGN